MALATVSTSAGVDTGTTTAAAGRVTTASGNIGYFRSDIQCRAAGSNEARPLGAVLAGPEAETLYAEAASLTPLASLGADGYALTVATRAFSTDLARGGGDVLLVGLAPDFTPRWATVHGGPAPDGPLSLSRTADGSLAIIGTTTSNYSSSLLRFLEASPESILVSKHARDGQLQWAQVHTPGELVIANPIVAMSDNGVVFGGTVKRDRRYAGFVQRLDDDGKLRWARLLGPDFEVGVTWLVPTSDGGVLAGGPRQRMARPGVKAQDLSFEIWLARLQGDGRPVWAKSYALASGWSQVIAAPLRHRQGWLIVREPRYDKGTDRSRFPIFEVDEEGQVRWSAEYELEGNGKVTTILPAAGDGYLLFGPASPKEGLGGTLTIELGPDGDVRSSTWIDVASALSTAERAAFMGGDPVAAVRDADGRHVLMGDFMSLPRALLANAKPGSRPPPDLREQLKGAVFLLRTGADGQVQGCSLPLQVSRRSLPVRVENFDLVTTELPAGTVSDIPASRLDFKRLEPR
ncbi:MAG: hypothetical protein J0L57_13335 [Burkholderiales bacterium]|nr:hypothetical protein [Burkholderiales bacterium]